MERQEELLIRARDVIRDLREKLAAAEQNRSEPIAIVGMACRFPGGADTLEGLWRMIESGAHAVGRIPRNRWDADAYYEPSPSGPGKISTRFGAFLEHVDAFDSAFFDITPREASQMDPQQRILLETAWHALEDAGLTRQNLAGSETGVFVGVHSMSVDYYMMQAAVPESIGTYTGPGAAHDVIAGRLAYLLDLHGPALAVNTACSSSLTAVHLACRSLQSGDCRIAIAGGVNLILQPESMIVTSQLGLLSPDGRCKAFDASSDGMGRGEGCGIVVLRKLSDAIAAGDQIHAVIRGSAVTQDGRTNGLTAPNGLSQRMVLRKALDRAGVRPSEIGYVEAHGTGTRLGDPIEVEALADVIGKSGAGLAPCVLGSVKANIAHPEGAAGIAGLLKAALVLEKRYFPPVAGLKKINPHLNLAGTRLEIPFTGRKWEREDKRYAGVSSFGWSGTNVHVVLEEAPERASAAPSADPVAVIVSAATPEALCALARAYAEALAPLAGSDLRDFAYTSCTRRTPHRYRIAAAGSGATVIAHTLLAKAANPPLVQQTSLESRLVFLYPDGDAACVALGRRLLSTDDVFRAAIGRCGAAIGAVTGWDLTAELARREADSRLQKPAFAQPAAFAIQAAITELLRTKWGVQPQATAGVGVGEISAAWAAGVLKLEDAARLAVIRGVSLRTAGSAAREMTAASANISAAPSAIPFYSTITTAPATSMRGDYWVRNLKGPARLAATMQALLADGFNTFLHFGEAAALEHANTVSLVDLAIPPDLGLPQALAHLFEAGIAIDWKPLYSDGGRCVPLPVYPFQRKRYWIEGAAGATATPQAPADWFYQIAWQPKNWPAETAPDVRATARNTNPWGVLCGKSATAAPFLEAFAAGGMQAIVLNDESSLSGQLAGILDVRALEAGRSSPQERVAQVTRLCQEMLRLALTIPICLVTRGAEAIGNGAPDLSQAAVRGCGVSLAAEHPELWGGIIDLDPESAVGAAAANAVIRQIRAGDGEDDVAFRGSERLAARLRSMPAPPKEELRIDPQASYVITGAFGGIGLNMAGWLASRGARNVVLVSRSGSRALEGDSEPARTRAEAVQALRDLGVNLRVEACDISDAASTERLFGELGANVRGIIHAAAEIRLRPLAEISDADIHASFGAKVNGAINLDRVTRALPLDFLVFFSSLSAVLGGRESCAYGAANAVLDALAEERCKAGLPAVSVIWGRWDVSNDRVTADQSERIQRSGLRRMRPQAALNGMGRILAGKKAATCVVADVDWSVRKPAFEANRESRLLDDITAQAAAATDTAEAQSLAERLQSTAPAAREDVLIELVSLHVRRVFKMEDGDSLDIRRGFFELGLDSLMSVELRKKLQSATGLSLPGTITLNYPSVMALAKYLNGRLSAPAAGEPAPAAAVQPTIPPPSSPAEDEAIAVLSDDEAHAALAAELCALNGDSLE